MTHATVSKTEQSLHEQIKNQDSGHHFLYSCRVVHKEFVPPGVTVNQKQLEVPDHLKKRVVQIQMEIADDWTLRASSRQCALTHSIVSL
jgi:hypothetical protein